MCPAVPRIKSRGMNIHATRRFPLLYRRQRAKKWSSPAAIRKTAQDREGANAVSPEVLAARRSTCYSDGRISRPPQETCMLGIKLDTRSFLDRVGQELLRIDPAEVKNLSYWIFDCYEQKRTVFICGNGGC